MFTQKKKLRVNCRMDLTGHGDSRPNKKSARGLLGKNENAEIKEMQQEYEKAFPPAVKRPIFPSVFTGNGLPQISARRTSADSASDARTEHKIKNLSHRNNGNTFRNDNKTGF